MMRQDRYLPRPTYRGDDMEPTLKTKLFDVLDDMRVAFPAYADELGTTYDDETMLVRKAGPSETLEVQPATIIGDITTLAVDSYNEVVLPEGIDKTRYLKNNVVLRAHNYTEFLPHGENAWLKPYPTKAPTRIRAATKYYLDDDYGLKVYNYRAAKRPLGYSIGFIPIKSSWGDSEDWKVELEKWQDRYVVYNGGNMVKADMPMPDLIYLNWVLLEYSDVVVPANPDTVALYVSKGLIEPDEAEDLIVETYDGLTEHAPKEVDTDIALLNATQIEQMSRDLAENIKEVSEQRELLNKLLAQDKVDIPAAVREALKSKTTTNEITLPEQTALKDFSISSIVAKAQGKLE